MRTVAAVAGTTLALSLAACGNPGVPEEDRAAQSASEEGPDGAATSSPDRGSAIVDLSDQVVLAASPYQPSQQDPVVLCFGPQASIYPPNCSGPELVGEFSWTDYDTQREGGITWTDDGVFAVGHYDPDAGAHGTFTLTQPLRSDPPRGYTLADPAQMDLRALCQDPSVETDPSGQDPREGGTQQMDEEQALSMLLRQDLPGYSTSRLSEGGVMNVLLAEGTDMDTTRAAIREVYTGPLCLDVRDVPSQADLREAQNAVSELPELRFHSIGTPSSDARLHVDVEVADRETVDAIHAAAEPWLTPDQIVISSAGDCCTGR